MSSISNCQNNIHLIGHCSWTDRNLYQSESMTTTINDIQWIDIIHRYNKSEIKILQLSAVSNYHILHFCDKTQFSYSTFIVPHIHFKDDFPLVKLGIGWKKFSEVLYVINNLHNLRFTNKEFCRVRFNNVFYATSFLVMCP